MGSIRFVQHITELIVMYLQSDEHDGEDDLEGDPSFDKVRVLLEALLADGQKALEHKSKATGRVLTYYDGKSSNNFHKLVCSQFSNGVSL